MLGVSFFLMVAPTTPWKTPEACEEQGLWRQVLQLLTEVQPDVTLYDLAIKACERGWDG